MKDPKKKIILDITPLQYGYFQNSARSGIYFTLKNVMLQLLKREDIDLFFNLDLKDSPNVEISVPAVLKSEFPESSDWILSRTFSEVPSKLLIFCNRQNAKITKAKERFRNNPLVFFFLRGCYFVVNRILRPLSSASSIPKLKNISYLSLMLDPPEYIKKQISAEKRYLLLYDTIPLSIPEYAGQKSGWFGNVINNISAKCNYMAISKSTRDHFIHFFPELAGKNIPVVYLAAADYFQPTKDKSVEKKIRSKYHIPAKKKIIFSHCSLAPHKNLEMLFRAFSVFYKSNPNWIMLFSGANIGEKMERLKKIAEENELPDSAFAFTGYVEDMELPVLYSIADLFCFVSLFEGFGLPVLEAMQCGCPCIVSNRTSLPEVAGDAARIVDPENLQEIAAAMNEIASDPALRKEMAKKGLKQAKKFSWKKTADHILEAVQ